MRVMCRMLNQYEVQVQARNRIGTGPKSRVLRAVTRGAGPATPDLERLFRYRTRFFLLFCQLIAYSNGLC